MFYFKETKSGKDIAYPGADIKRITDDGGTGSIIHLEKGNRVLASTDSIATIYARNETYSLILVTNNGTKYIYPAEKISRLQESGTGTEIIFRSSNTKKQQVDETVATIIASIATAANALTQVLLIGNDTGGTDIVLTTGDALSSEANGTTNFMRLLLDIAASTVDKDITIGSQTNGFSITDGATNGINSNSTEFTLKHNNDRVISFKGSSAGKHIFDLSANTVNRTYTLQDGDGTLAFLSDLTGGVTVKGGYDAATNTPDLDTTPIAILQGDMYVVTVAGTFYTTPVAVGDMLIARVDSAAAEADWIIVEHNLQDATTTVKGIVALATATEVKVGTNNTKAMTPLSFTDAGGFLKHTQTITTSDATPTKLANSITLATDTVRHFEATVIGREAATGDIQVYKFKGAIKNIAGTTTIVDAVSSESIAEDLGTATWGVPTVTADDSVDTLEITVTGEAAHTIKWESTLISFESDI
jgi:hypothetical protein